MQACPPKINLPHGPRFAAAREVGKAAPFSAAVTPWGDVSCHVYRPGVRKILFVTMEEGSGAFRVLEFFGHGLLDERETGCEAESLERFLAAALAPAEASEAANFAFPTYVPSSRAGVGMAC